MALNINRKVRGDKVVVSRAAQADAQTPATLNKLILFDEDSFLRRVREAETNEDEKTGFNEPTDVNVLGFSATGRLSQAKAIPDAIAWMMRMLTGPASTTALAAGFRHTFTLNSYPDEPDYFTAAHKRGGSTGTSTEASPADYERHEGLSLGNFELNAVKEEFISIGADVVGVGRSTSAQVTFIATGVDLTVMSPTVDFSVFGFGDPEGATPAEQLTHINAFADDDGDGIYELELTANDYNMEVATFDDPSGTNMNANVRVTYWVDADSASSDQDWQNDVGAAVGQTEFKLKSSNMRLYLNRAVDSGATPPTGTGGQVGGCELEEFTYRLERNAEPGRCWRTDEAASADAAHFREDAAQSVLLGDTTQRITVNRGIRDWLLKQNFDANSEFGIEIDAIGPEIGSGVNYEVHFYFPRVKILERELGVNDGKHRDQVEIAVLQDSTTSDPTMACVVINNSDHYQV